MPSRQRLQWPQPAWISTVTRWPMRELVDARAERHHRPHVFVAGREVLVERQAALDHRRRTVSR